MKGREYQLGEYVTVVEASNTPYSGKTGVVCHKREVYDLLGRDKLIKYTVDFDDGGKEDYLGYYLKPALKQLVKQEQTQEITDYRLVVEHNVNIGTTATLSVRRNYKWEELDCKVTLGLGHKDVKEFLEAVQKRAANWIEHSDSFHGYSGKLVCVESNDSGYIPGKVYEVKNGIMNDGLAKVFKSVAEINRYFANHYKFIPFVES